ncbi:MAG: hypothetical protein IJW33_05855 [Lentisphaeria bacterium]|nr:hypothetical protein [Lentisphaeria bacterium]
MNTRVYYIKNGRRITGPFPENQLSQMYRDGLLMSDDLISRYRVVWKSPKEFFGDDKKEVLPLDPPVPENLPEEKEEAVSEDFRDEITLTPEDLMPRESAPEPAPKPIPEPVPLPRTSPIISASLPAKVTVIPDPITSAIALFWNAPGQLENLWQMEALSAAYGSEKSDKNLCFAAFTAAGCNLLWMALGTAMLLVSAPEFFRAALISGTVTLAALLILLVLENLLLASAAKLRNVLDAHLMIMFLIQIPATIFAAGMPFAGIMLAGWENCPLWVKIAVVTFSGIILTGSLINFALGFRKINRRTFHFQTPAVVMLMIFFILQTLAVYPMIYGLFTTIQK